MNKYNVYFTVHGSIEMSAYNEGDAIKKFWEKESRYIINNLSRSSNVDMDQLKIEAKEVALKETEQKKVRLFGRG